MLGAKYWMNVWSSHLYYLENDVWGRLHKIHFYVFNRNKSSQICHYSIHGTMMQLIQLSIAVWYGTFLYLFLFVYPAPEIKLLFIWCYSCFRLWRANLDSIGFALTGAVGVLFFALVVFIVDSALYKLIKYLIPVKSYIETQPFVNKMSKKPNFFVDLEANKAKSVVDWYNKESGS